MSQKLGIVVIGRNEGARLVASLESVSSSIRERGLAAVVVYVDSGSTDGSIERARAMGAQVVSLDTSLPFSAGRARNLGMESVRQLQPDVEFVQFIDGDCRIAPDWIPDAVRFLSENPQHAIACGRRQETRPQMSIFNALCDEEWNTKSGDATECGGDFLARASAMFAAAGFNPELIAGEEPELCFRLRRSGWKIRRLDLPMTFHDAAMTRWSQWWKRSTRAGFAYAARAWLHRSSGEGYALRENARIAVWAWAPAALAAAASVLGSSLWWAFLTMYPLQVARLAVSMPKPLHLGRLTMAAFLVAGNWPQAVGQLSFLAELISGRREPIIEYK